MPEINKKNQKDCTHKLKLCNILKQSVGLLRSIFDSLNVAVVEFIM